jgi:hypothetical protein
VDLDHRQRARDQGVAERDARVGEPARVDEEAVGRAAGALDLVDQLALVVGLDRAELRARRLCLRREAGLDLGQGRPPVDLGLPGTQEVQVRAVEREDPERLGRGREP